ASGPAGSVTQGQPVSLTATVTSAAGTPSGTVNFLEGTTVVATGTLSGGTLTTSTSTLSVGSHTLFARYVGSGNFAASDSTPSFVVSVTSAGAATTSTALASSLPAGSVFTQSVTFTATVTSGGGTPGGTVTFFDNGSQIGTGTLNGSGQGTFSTSTLSVANHQITAVYGGNATFAGSTSGVVNQSVAMASTTTSLAVGSPNPSTTGQSVSFTATVTATAPATGPVNGGNVTFFDGGAPIGTGTLNGSGQGTLRTSTPSGGPHTITPHGAAPPPLPAPPAAQPGRQPLNPR